MINLLGSGGSSSDLNSLAAPDKATLGRRKSGNTDDVVRLLLEVSGRGIERLLYDRYILVAYAF